MTEEDEDGWANSTLFIFLAKNLKNIYNDKRPPPVPSCDASKEEHEKYVDWMRSNHMARFYCLSTMEEKLRKKFEHIEYARDLWDAAFEDLQTRPQSRKR